MCLISRAVKAMDSKSIGVGHHRFESCIRHHMLQLYLWEREWELATPSPYYSILKSHIIHCGLQRVCEEIKRRRLEKCM